MTTTDLPTVDGLTWRPLGTDVRLTMIDGQVLVRDARLQNQDAEAIAAEARTAARTLAARAGV